MKRELFASARRVPTEMLDVTPMALGKVIQDITRELVDRVVCELEKGESICSLETPRQIQIHDLCSVEISRSVKITRLVRCGECKHYNAGLECLVEGYGIERDPDWYCADGVRKEQE